MRRACPSPTPASCLSARVYGNSRAKGIIKHRVEGRQNQTWAVCVERLCVWASQTQTCSQKMTVSYRKHQVHWRLIAYPIPGLSPHISDQSEVWTLTFGEEKPAKYKYFTSITAQKGKMPSKNKNSLLQKCLVHLTFKTCQLPRIECTALSHLKSLKKKITTVQHVFGASTLA